MGAEEALRDLYNLTFPQPEPDCPVLAHRCTGT